MAEATHDRVVAPGRRPSGDLAPRFVRVVVAIGDEAARGRAVAALLAGREVKAVADVQEALASALDPPADVVLADVAMARKLVPVLRGDARTRLLTVVVLAGRSADGSVDAIDLEADEYLTEPLTPRDLCARVDAQARRAWARAEAIHVE